MCPIDSPQKEITTLAVDACGRHCGAAVTKGPALLGEQVLSGSRNHSELLLLVIDQLMDSLDLTLADMDLIAVTRGPGSFTGVRTGISTAQGLAFSLKKDLIGVSTLEVLAIQAGKDSGYVCPMIDARKKQVYTCLYDFSDGMKKVMVDTVVSPDEWLGTVPESVTFIGDGATVYRNKIERKKDEQFRILPPHMGIIRASTAAFAAADSYLQHRRNELAHISPEYLRPPDAVAGKKGNKVVN